MEGKSILFTGSKGGCGCSFLSYSVAAYYALKKEKNILLMDLSLGSFASRIIFGLEEKQVKDLGDVPRGIKDIDITLLKNLVINTEFSLNIILPPVNHSCYADLPDMGSFLKELEKYFQLIIIDMPIFCLDFTGWELLGQQDKISLVSSPSLMSVKNLNGILSGLSGLKADLPIDLVINKYNLKPCLSPALINSYINYPIKAFIPYDRDIEYLFLNQGPTHIFKYNLRITKSIASFADSIYEELDHV
ncbi:MAG: hypothetical protein K9H14_00235 [Actinomycetia bacterium]|nr:hypothetical protein [Actinomycetes bacterium]